MMRKVSSRSPRHAIQPGEMPDNANRRRKPFRGDWVWPLIALVVVFIVIGIVTALHG
jgi:hypothetical protein